MFVRVLYYVVGFVFVLLRSGMLCYESCSDCGYGAAMLMFIDIVPVTVPVSLPVYVHIYVLFLFMFLFMFRVCVCDYVCV